MRLFRSCFSIRPVVPYLKIFDEASKKAINIHGSFHGPSHRNQLSRGRPRPDVKNIMNGRCRGEQYASRPMSKGAGDAGDLATRSRLWTTASIPHSRPYVIAPVLLHTKYSRAIFGTEA